MLDTSDIFIHFSKKSSCLTWFLLLSFKPRSVLLALPAPAALCRRPGQLPRFPAEMDTDFVELVRQCLAAKANGRPQMTTRLGQNGWPQMAGTAVGLESPTVNKKKCLAFFWGWPPKKPTRYRFWTQFFLVNIEKLNFWAMYQCPSVKNLELWRLWRSSTICEWAFHEKAWPPSSYRGWFRRSKSSAKAKAERSVWLI